MRDQTAFGITRKEAARDTILLTKEDKTLLRELAKELRELAEHPREREKAKLWTRHNDLEATRPVVFCDPENGWNEIITEDMLRCKTELGQDWEMTLRKEICWASEMRDDKVVDAVFDVPYVAVESDWGMHEKKIGGEHGGAYKWVAPLKDFSDMDKLHYPKIEVDYEGTRVMRELAEEVFGGLLDVRVKHKWWWTLGMTWTLANLRGLETIMYDLYDHPDEFHKLMAFLRDGHLAKLDFLEANGLLPDNTGNTYVGSGGYGFTNELPAPGFDAQHVRLRDMWGFCESQETTSVSPEMFAEFILPYQIPIMERFGLNCYGCCEPLEKRWADIAKIPRLRRVSVSPWADASAMAQCLGNKYIYSYKPHPTLLAVPHIDEGAVRKSLKDIIAATKGCALEIIMKDNNTLGGNKNNAFRWVEIALEEANNA